MPYLQQYHTMLVNDLNEPTSDTPSQTPGSNSSSSSSSASTTGEVGQPTASSGETTPNTPGPTGFGPNVIVIGGGADNRRQRFFNNINDMMHLMGHLMHNISDLHVNIRDRPPRQMHTMSSMTSAQAGQTNTQAIIGTTTMPVEATIQIPIMAQLGPQGIQIQHVPNSSSTQTTTSTTSTPTPNPTSASTPTAQSQTTNSNPLNQSWFFKICVF